MLNAVVKHGVREVLLASTMSFFRSSRTEQKVRQSGSPVTSIVGFRTSLTRQHPSRHNHLFPPVGSPVALRLSASLLATHYQNFVITWKLEAAHIDEKSKVSAWIRSRSVSCRQQASDNYCRRREEAERKKSVSISRNDKEQSPKRVSKRGLMLVLASSS